MLCFFSIVRVFCFWLAIVLSNFSSGRGFWRSHDAFSVFILSFSVLKIHGKSNQHIMSLQFVSAQCQCVVSLVNISSKESHLEDFNRRRGRDYRQDLHPSPNTLLFTEQISALLFFSLSSPSPPCTPPASCSTIRSSRETTSKCQLNRLHFNYFTERCPYGNIEL